MSVPLDKTNRERIRVSERYVKIVHALLDETTASVIDPYPYEWVVVIAHSAAMLLIDAYLAAMPGTPAADDVERIKILRTTDAVRSISESYNQLSVYSEIIRTSTFIDNHSEKRVRDLGFVPAALTEIRTTIRTELDLLTA